MSSAKLKAKELFDKYDSTLTYLESKTKVKECILIAVDEILSMKIVRKDNLTDEYWESVKQEIDKL